jgi:hypothetical protein
MHLISYVSLITCSVTNVLKASFFTLRIIERFIGSFRSLDLLNVSC